MNSKIKGLSVALEFDINEESIECIINAIKMLKFVVDVDIIEVNANDYFNRSQIKFELREKFYKFLQDELSFNR